jgi:DNA-binding transcriptional MerR regulator
VNWRTWHNDGNASTHWRGGVVATAVGHYRIGELASRVGLTERTIRYYEELGLLESVKRLDGGVRVYTDDDLHRLRYIRKLKTLGLSLQEMLELESMYQRHRSNRTVLPRLMELLDVHLDTISEKVGELQALQDEIRSYREHVARRLLEERGTA